MKKQIEDSNDVKMLVDTFYGHARKDEVIGYIFEDIAHVNWEEHLPQMYAFWDNAIFYSGAYKGNVITPHIELNKKIKLQPQHFERWLHLFTQSVDELFEGSLAEDLKMRVMSIGGIMEAKLNQM